jgi:ArsR family metal-binding transcriptional regulator
MLIENYEIDLYCPPCDPGSEAWVATVRTEADLTELMPYVNAVVDKGEYIPGIPTLVWREEAHKYFLKSHELGINNLHDRAHAERKVEKLVRFLNETWDERESITPDLTIRTKPTVLEVFKLLPRTNCGECGVPSCMAFAAQLTEGNKSLEDCPPLLEETQAENLESLRDLGL